MGDLIRRLEEAGPCPRDRQFWAVTADETVECLEYWPGGSAWSGSPLFSCVDDEKAAYAEADLIGWTDSPEEARQAAAILRAHQKEPSHEG